MQLDEAHVRGRNQNKGEKQGNSVKERKEVQDEKKRLKWVRRISELSSEGMTFGKIKSRMNVSKKTPEEQEWFETEGLRICQQTELETVTQG